jgi:hypothetical protein
MVILPLINLIFFISSDLCLINENVSFNRDLGMAAVQPDTSECSECESDASKATCLPRSQSERLLSLCKDFINHERELREKYHVLVSFTENMPHFILY